MTKKKKPPMTAADVSAWYHDLLSKEVLYAVDSFRLVHGADCLMVATVSCEHDDECFKWHGEAMCAYLATQPFSHTRDCAQWLLTLWNDLQADLSRRNITDKDRAHNFRGLDVITEVWKTMYRDPYFSKARNDVVKSLQLAVDGAGTPVHALPPWWKPWMATPTCL